MQEVEEYLEEEDEVEVDMDALDLEVKQESPTNPNLLKGKRKSIKQDGKLSFAKA